MVATLNYKEGCLLEHKVKGMSFGAPIKNLSSSVSSTLAIMLPMSDSATKAAKWIRGVAPRNVFTIAMPIMLENNPLQTSLESFNL